LLTMTVVVPILVGVAYAVLSSLIREPHRRRFNAVFVAGAGAAYLSGGGLGPWEVVFAAVMTYLAFRALESWTFTGIAWLLHAGWDAVHYATGHQILSFVPHSSLGCAICDPVIALWCFTGGRPPLDLLRVTRSSSSAPRSPR
jgi:hypothetical protein